MCHSEAHWALASGRFSALREQARTLLLCPSMTTRPAPAEPAPKVPPSARLTPLAIAALENGVHPEDVRAYLESRK